jgi:glycosyltransferase involved in cell wall biosynthesis
MKKLRLAIIGTRGIPNQYGGFEQFAEYLAIGLAEKGHDVTVYCPHNHSEQSIFWRGVHRVLIYDPEEKMGTVGQFIYDLNCIRHSRKQNFDTILQLGYTSSSIWGPMLPKAKVFTNMDGLEWKRSKFSKPVQLFLKFAERLAIWFSNEWISDSIGIQQYLIKKYGKESTYIPYGAVPFNSPDESMLQSYQVYANKFYMLVARMEPENNIELILDGYVAAGCPNTFIVVGKTSTEFGNYLVQKYQKYTSIKFVGGIYQLEMLNQLRYHCLAYFHGHSVGGTNPSLLEAMASQAFIIAHNNVFNSSILGDEALYFNSITDLVKVFQQTESIDFIEFKNLYIKANYSKIIQEYSWEKIIQSYEDLLCRGR